MKSGGHFKIDAERVSARLTMLASFTEPDRPWTRTAFSDLHLDARAWLADEMKSAGLTTEIDAGGNLVGRSAGSDNSLPVFASGSHSDTVPAGGRFDGALGVIAALEVASAAHNAGYRMRHPFEVIDFLAEEPNKYGLSCIGSRAMAGELNPEALALKASDGTTLAEGIRRMGGDPARLNQPLRKSGDMVGFVEIHIEQGRVLEAAEEDIGVVTGIVGITRLAVEIEGRADHSGATPMELRRDALVAAAMMITSFEAHAMHACSKSLVATVGKLDVHPNASNVTPGMVSLVLEVRASQSQAISKYMQWAEWTIRTIADERGVVSRTRLLGQSDPILMATPIQLAISDAAAARNFKYRSMPSGAGHDAAHVGLFSPSGMIFVPCLEGRSHCPEEYCSPEQIAKGVQVLADTLFALDAKL